VAVMILADGSRVSVDKNGNLTLLSGTCHCTRRHAPRISSFDVHHIRPQSWGGQSVAANLAVVCPNTHRMAHLCLNEFVRARGVPTAEVLAIYPRFAQALARQGWASRDPNAPTPMTLSHPNA
jgi:hypothetical protein